LLSAAEVRRVVDVRTIPRSRTNPQYNPEALAEAFSESRIDYEHIATLGGPTIPIAGRNSAGATQQNFKNTLRSSRGFAAWLGEIGSRLSTQRVTSCITMPSSSDMFDP
jgi:hypothetical protein